MIEEKGKMKAVIDDTHFGNITIAGNLYEHDVIIRLSGEVEKRKKSLSRLIYGTSHKISLGEAQYIYEKGARELIIGTGQIGYVELSDEAVGFFKKMDCAVHLMDTKQAVQVWNSIEGRAIGLFHVTC